MIMKRTAPTDLNEIAGNPQKFNFYDYPAYTFDSKYANDEFQKKVITLPCRKGGSRPLMRCVAG